MWRKTRSPYVHYITLGVPSNSNLISISGDSLSLFRPGTSAKVPLTSLRDFLLCLGDRHSMKSWTKTLHIIMAAWWVLHDIVCIIVVSSNLQSISIICSSKIALNWEDDATQIAIFQNVPHAGDSSCFVPLWGDFVKPMMFWDSWDLEVVFTWGVLEVIFLPSEKNNSE